MALLLRTGTGPFSMPLDHYRRRFYHPDEDQVALAALADSAYSRGEPATVETRLLRADGVTIWVRASVSIETTEDGQSVVMGLIQDITSLREAAERLAAQTELTSRLSERLQVATRAASIGVWDWDVSEDRRVWDDTMYRLYGRAPDSPLGAFDEWAAAIAPEDRGRVVANIGQALLHGDEFSDEFRVTWPDGSRRNVCAMARIIRDADGRARRMVGVKYDVTERRAAERQIRHLNRVYALVSSINAVITRETDPDRILAAACHLAVDKGQFLMAWVGVVDDQRRVRAVAQDGHVEGYLDLIDLNLRDPQHSLGPTGRCLLSGRYQVVNDIAHDEHYAPWRDEALRRGYRSSAAFPIKVDGTVVCAINLYASESDFFDADEIQLLDKMSVDVSFALTLHRKREEKQRADQSFRALQRLFAQAFEHAAVGMALVSVDGNLLTVNRAFSTMLGDTADELQATTFQALTHPHDLEADLAQVRRLLDGDAESYQIEKRYLHKDGHVVWALLSVSLVRDDEGRPLHFISQVQDISERVRAESALKESDERFHQISTNVGEVFWLREAGTPRLLYLSPAYERVWGRPAASALADPAIWAETVHPDDRERVLAAAGTQTDGNFDETYRIMRPDGEVRWVRARTVPVRAADGTVIRIAGIAEDITERLELEERVRQSQKLEAIGQLAGGVAHDFNNLLAVIMMDTGVASAMTSSPELQELLDEIAASADRGAQLTRQLLAFSRRQILRPQPTDLNQTVTSLTRMLQRVMREDVEIRLRLSDTPLITRADPGMLDQVLLNLAVNARDAMPHGGSLTIETAAATIDAGAAPSADDLPDGSYASLIVRDTGVGIPPDLLPRLFEPFFTTKEPGRGTGLGLATVFGIVKQHNGTIAVQSTVGAGTTFRILLPLSNAPAQAPEPDDTESDAVGGETVLLVEHEPVVRRVARALLEASGYEVLEAADGVEALHLWEQHHDAVQLLMTDLVMPGGISGQELGAILKARRPHLRVVFVAAPGQESGASPLNLSRHEHLLHKPYEPAQFLQAVRRSLDA
jgi:PAS domain S-box-containing protein